MYLLHSYIKERPCRSPTVRLPSLSSNVTSAVRLRGANQILIPSEVQLDCELSSTTVFNWEVFHLYSDKVLSRNGSSELLIPRRSLPVGSYSVRLTVKMGGTQVFGVAEGYIRITGSPIVARIAGGTKTKRGFNKTLVFNASMSHDPDAFDSEVRKFLLPFKSTAYRKPTHNPSNFPQNRQGNSFVLQVKIRAHVLVRLISTDFIASNLFRVTSCHLFR